MAGIDRDLCRRSAAECAVLARATVDPERKQLLLIRAQEWLKLAYADHNAEFENLLCAFNDGQLGRPAQARRPNQQPAQQQQSKQRPDRKP